MTAVVAILAKERGDVSFVHQSLYYPVTDAAQDTDSYREFADGPYLTAAAMAWFWDSYLPDVAKRGDVTASPLRATTEQLTGLPEAFLITDENDVLRDEGEAYARRLVGGGRANHERAVQRHAARLHDAEPAPPVARRHRSGRAGGARAPQGPRPRLNGRGGAPGASEVAATAELRQTPCPGCPAGITSGDDFAPGDLIEPHCVSNVEASATRDPGRSRAFRRRASPEGSPTN